MLELIILTSFIFLMRDIMNSFPKKNYSGERRKRKNKRNPQKAAIPENALQSSCEEILRIYGIKYFRIKDELYRYVITAPDYVKMPFFDNFRGFPDLHIVFKNSKRYLDIELKTKIGKQRRSQKDYEKLSGNYFICRSIEDFVKILTLEIKLDKK